MFLIAAIGAAVGIGKIWRFPYLTFHEGGGTFLATYIVLFFIIGVPLLFIEFFVGRHYRQNIISAFEKLSKKWSFVGWIPVIFGVIIMAYYVMITGWTLAYTAMSLGDTYLPFDAYAKTWGSSVFSVLVCALCYVFLSKGFQKGLEKVMFYFIPLLFILFAVFGMYAYTLPGKDAALSFMADVHMPSFHTVLSAISQMFFSLSVGWGIMFVYSTYETHKDNVLKISYQVGLADLAISLISAFIVFSLLFSSNLPIANGPGLSFEVLPLAFIGQPFGNLLMALFFFLLFITAITTCLPSVQLMRDVLEEKYKWKRNIGLFAICALIALVSLVPSLGYSPLNLTFFGQSPFIIMDEFLVGKVFVLLTVLYVLVLVHSYKKFDLELKKEAGVFQPLLSVWLKYVAPLIVLAVGIFQFL